METAEAEGISLPEIPSTHSPTCYPAQINDCNSPSCVSHVALLNNHRTQQEIGASRGCILPGYALFRALNYLFCLKFLNQCLEEDQLVCKDTLHSSLLLGPTPELKMTPRTLKVLLVFFLDPEQGRHLRLRTCPGRWITSLEGAL